MFHQQCCKYFPNGIPGLSLAATAIGISFHDIGKRVSDNTGEQHQHTTDLIKDYRNTLPLEDHEIDYLYYC
ncbi:MAG: hypothetical protein SGJ02_07295 [bacterium]|nr:hypothetical protein [bacterium]